MLSAPERTPGEFRTFLYLGVPFFLWVLADDVAEALLRPSGGVGLLLLRAAELLVGSLVGAAILGSVGDCLAPGACPTVERFFRAMRRYGPRFLGVYLIVTLLSFALVAVAIVRMGLGPGAPSQHQLLLARLCLFPVIGLRWLWASEIVAENVGVLRGLVRGIGTAARSPRVLLLAAVLGAVSTAAGLVDMVVPERPSLRIALASAIPGAAVLALVLVALAPRLIAAIREARGVVGAPGEAATGGDLGAAPADPRDRLARTSLWLAVFSFVPLVHFATLLAGLRSLRRPGLFSVRGLVAAGLGAFFTAGYVLAVAGHLLPRARVPEPALGFLAKADPSLAEATALLEASQWQQAIDRVEEAETKAGESAEKGAGARERSWAADSLVGIARTRLGDHDAAEAAFARALAGAGPSPPAEVHYFHGRLQMARRSFPAAEASFAKALALDPALGDAERLRSLARNVLELPRAWKIIGYGVILLFLLTTHEVGHAWAAWKLGDDTAMREGRISLNPLRHLDPVGSVLLPALLLWRNADVLFGWARPVPVTREKLRNPARDHMVVSFAGPGVNLVVCLAAFLLLLVACLGVRAAWPGATTFQLAQPFGAMAVAGLPSPRAVGGVLLFVRELLFTSLVLGCFNLLPVPPLDGSWILSGLLPGRGQALYEHLRRWSFVLFLLLVMTPAFNVFVAIPAGLTWGLLHLSLAAMGFG